MWWVRALFVWVVLLFVLAEAKAPPTSLRIGVKHRPSKCDVKSKAGDRLHMYVVPPSPL